MSNIDGMTDGAFNSSISGVEKLAICNLQQETNRSDSCTNVCKTTPATDIQQGASTLESFPESETTRSDTISREASCTFEPFPRLAIELRLVIWGLACSQERLLEITTHPTDISFDLGAPTPPVLFVNHESRQEAEKYYKKIRLHFGNLDSAQVCLFRTFFVNPDKDIFDCSSMKFQRNYWRLNNNLLYYYDINSGRSIGTWMCNLFNELRTVKYSHWNRHDGLEFLGHRAVTLMPNLKEFILKPTTDIPRNIWGAFGCRKEQNVCIEEMQSALQKENEKNPACPTPVVKFEISVQTPSSAL
ncbi:uncharacterized protein EAE97_000936 [Botrytis byssoidea]|uniref:2EXR domain-containing protein n=1 Tax=Botrytis byssoidea TaxID=139641 RepID=A0A9P5IW66_9HELO|nr:uncharacterized protein EAE97_000936 [Botrytis byssoidea]KAF7953537.1 hypothetical protein EAE97_000936 [Botrytis byssoidea]